MSDQLPDELRELIARERESSSLSSDAAARIAERLSGTLAVPVAPPDPFAAASSVAAPAATQAIATATVATTWTAAKLAPIALAFLIGGVSGSAITARVMHVERAPVVAEPPPVTPAPAPRPAPPPPPADVAVIAPEPAAGVAAPGLEPPRAAQPAGKVGAAQTAPDPNAIDRELRAERELLELARRAIARGHAEDALAALTKHDRRFAKGRLAEERDSLRVPALVMLGRHDEAMQRAQQFRTRYPTSLFGPVVERAVQGMP